MTLDAHAASAFEEARGLLARDLPGLDLRMHVAAEWASDPAAAEACRADLARADFIVVTHVFLEEQIAAIVPALTARRDHCDAIACVMSAGPVMRMTRLGRFSMGGPEDHPDQAPSPWSPAGILKRLRGDSRPGQTTGEAQMRQIRRIPQLLRFIPGPAQDVRAYYLVLQYWLAGSADNLANLVRYLVGRYAAGPRQALHGAVHADPPVEYPEVGVYHPDLPAPHLAPDVAALPRRPGAPRVGLLLMRSYLLGGNRAHYDGVIRALEARGLAAVPAFAYGLDARAAVERFFLDAHGRPAVDAVVSLTGFSLVGGPAYNDAEAAHAVLTRLDVPYLAAQTLEFQSTEEWRDDPRGLNPLQATLQVALPELDGATGPIVFAGKTAEAAGGEGHNGQRSRPVAERVERLADRVARLVALRRTPVAERRVAVVLFNFPPNAGSTGTAAYLGVFESLYHLLVALRDRGYAVDVPRNVDELRARIVDGNRERLGALANVAARIPTDDHVRRERYLREIEAQWGPAPGRQQADGASLHVLGERFGNLFVGVQPAMGYEGDPMRLLFERGFAPTHAFSAFYRWIREDFGAHAVLHFGTHGALEFMPGKQVGLDDRCWPDRLIGDLPNLYLYASNNPSEGTIAKRRGAATLVSYLTPPVAHAGLYRGLLDLKATIDRYRRLDPDAAADARALVETIQAQAAAVDLCAAEPAWNGDGPMRVEALRQQVLDLEYSLIPQGLHVVGQPPSPAERADLLLAVSECGRADMGLPSLAEAGGTDADGRPTDRARAALEVLVRTGAVQPALEALAPPHRSADAARRLLERLADLDRLLREDAEIPALLRALDGRYIAPAPGGDLLRTPAILPTGRNLYGFDPYRVPSTFAMADGRRQAERLLARYVADSGRLPETVAMVLWGTDNMKTEGGPVAQALALMGAEPRFDPLGRLAGARLVPLAELGRPRIDVVLSLSGIFRDLLPLQTRLLAEAALLAAQAEEPAEANFIRKHALAVQAETACDLETAALRVFSNAEGAYGSNVNHLVDSGRWQDDGELADTFVARKGFAYGRDGRSSAAPALLRRMLGQADVSYQNLDSVELGVTDVDYYFESLGAIAKVAEKATGRDVAVMVGDQTRGDGTVRSIGEQVALETRTRVLNPRWYEGMLKHGYEGVRQIEAHVTTTLGWSATTGVVPDWVYTRVTETYVLDEAMRDRLAALNPHASMKLTNRLLEAHERGFWSPDQATLDALRDAADTLEDRLEGVVA